ncbi:MAG: hypothetical protein ACRDVM_08550, partial [Acidimicrobiia bacterium]
SYGWRWERLDSLPELSSLQHLTPVAGRALAVGHERAGPGVVRWNGRAWESMEIEAWQLFPTHLGAAAIGPTEGGSGQVILHTLDGSDWETLAVPIGEGSYVEVVPVAGGTAVLVDRLLWFSPDLETWEQLSLDLEHGFEDASPIIIPHPDRLLVAGTDHGVVRVWEWLGGG